jgi:dihydroneopterin aldolase
MIDELARAYAQTAVGTADPLDRISVRDYVREVEIGAFKSERGVTQHVRFNVVLEVSRHAASVSDDVDQVISYDMIVEAIDDILSTGRINLLETCAERVAEKCLVDPRAVRALVRIEKLDRIPGALGVEIMRNRVPETVRKVSAVAAETTPGVKTLAPVVLALPAKALDSRHGAGWRRALKAHEGAIVALAAPGALLEAARRQAAELGLGREEKRRLELLAYDQAAWAFGGRDLPVVETRTELQHAIKTGAPVVWAPFKLMNEIDEDGADPAAVLARLIRETGAAKLLNADDAAEVAPGALGEVEVEVISRATPESLV